MTENKLHVGIDTERRTEPDTAESNGGRFQILLHNDEITPYDYVIHLLSGVFFLSDELADHIAWTAHNKGAAVVVVRPRSEAHKLVTVAHSRARADGFPLSFSLLPEG